MFNAKAENPQHLEVLKNEDTIKRAKEILRRDFLGVEAIKKFEEVVSRLSGRKVEFVLDDLPPLPYSEEDLQIAKDCGEMLVLRPKVIRIDGEKVPITLLTLIELTILFSKDQLGKPQKVFNPSYWYMVEKEENFATSAEEIKSGWSLVKKDVFKGSTRKTWYDQEQLLREYEKNLRERGAKNATVRRRTAAETVFDVLLYYVNTGKRLLTKKYDWGQSKTQHSFSSKDWESFVAVGKFDSLPPQVHGLLPKFYSKNLGVCPSR